MKDATNEAIRDWCCHPADTYYIIGSTVGPVSYTHLDVYKRQALGGVANGEAKHILAPTATANKKGTGLTPICMALCKAIGASKTCLLYTSARNGKDIVQQIVKKTGIRVEIIDGQEEAHIVYDNHIEDVYKRQEEMGGLCIGKRYIDSVRCRL